MKTRLSIAIAAMAVVGVAFVGLVPREARADLTKVKKALEGVKTMKVDMTRFRPGGKIDKRTLWFENDEWEQLQPDPDGVLRIDMNDDKFKGGEIQIGFTDETMPPTEFVFEKLVDGADFIFDDKELVEVHPGVFVVKGFEDQVEIVEGEHIVDAVEALDLKDIQMLDNSFVLQGKSPFKSVFNYDPKTNLPKDATRFKRVGDKWEKSAELKFTYNEPMPKKKK